MKTLDRLSVNESAVIASIEASPDLKERFFSFGVRRGATLKVKAFSLAGSTIEIEVGGTMIALRNEEAKSIKVNLVCGL